MNTIDIANSVLKSVIVNAMNKRFPGFTSIYINVDDKKAMIKFENTSHVTNISPDESKHFTMLAESKGLKYIKSIYLKSADNTIVIRGDKDLIL